MRTAIPRTGSRPRRWFSVVGAALGGVLLTALVAAPAYADATPAGTSTAAVSARSGGSTWVQTDPVDFYHNLSGPDRAYEQVFEVPAITIPFPGVWEVSYSARTNLGNPTSFTGLYVHTALFTNGALLQGSQAITGKSFNPGETAQDTIGQTLLTSFRAGDVVRLYAYRIGQQGGAGVFSNPDGRTGVMAHWVSP